MLRLASIQSAKLFQHSSSASTATQLLRSGATRGSLKTSNGAAVSGLQYRYSSIFSKYVGDSQVTVLKKRLDASPTEANLTEYLRKLSDVRPQEAATVINRGWSNGSIPMNEDLLKLYLKAVGNMKMIDSLNITQLLSLMISTQNRNAATAAGTGGASSAASGGAAFSAEEMANLLRASAASGGGGGFNGAGRSPSEPIYVSR